MTRKQEQGKGEVDCWWLDPQFYKDFIHDEPEFLITLAVQFVGTFIVAFLIFTTLMGWYR